ncbi:MAG TPA: RNA 2',3'-cyclic phosphodiesterase [Mobilitalea sp.]|nr:RNA 2',3'-cyclic phosphodiesterase [Mobilitalea sp.]
MRLFTAITFTEEIKDYLYNIIDELRKNTAGGTFTTRDNLHLTLNFIGETDRLELVKAAMDQSVAKVKAQRFTMAIGGFGLFKRREGDIYWVGVERENTLWKLQKELVKELKDAGYFDLDDREYKPHLTLGRRVKVKSGFDEKAMAENIKPMKTDIVKISLMKSERIQGKLVYTEICHVELI